MKIELVPARQGWQWIVSGFKLTKAFALPLSVIMLCFVVSVMIPSVIPTVGGFVPFLMTPFLTLGLMSAFRCAEKGVLPTPKALLEGAMLGKDTFKRLVQLGVINLGASLLILVASTLIDGGILMGWATGAIALSDPQLKDPRLLTSMPVFLLLFIPLQAVLWYAPQFTAWHKAGVMQSLFYSWVAVWRNKKAFALFALGWLGVFNIMMLVGALLSSALVGIFGKGIGSTAATVMFSALSLFVMTATYASIWFTYRSLKTDEVQTTIIPNENPQL